MARIERLPGATDERLRDVLHALYRHPFTTEQLIQLNPTFAVPFPVHAIHRRTADGRIRTYHEARTLNRLLADAIGKGLLQKAEYAVTGRGQRPYYLLTEEGFRLLFPDQDPPKKGYVASGTHERRVRRSPFFTPIPLGRQEHDFAVSQAVVHSIVQAKRDGIRIASCHTRKRVALEIPASHALQTDLRPFVRLDPDSGEPIRPALTIFPDATWDFQSPSGEHLLRFDEIDGGTETVLSREDRESIERKVRLYDHYADLCPRRFRVRFLTYRPRTLRRLQSIIECACTTLRNPARPLFLFATLERYLQSRGALTRRVFLDHCARPVACCPVVNRRGFATGESGV